MFGAEEANHDFLYWLKAGVAFTLPLLILGTIALILFAYYVATTPGVPTH